MCVRRGVLGAASAALLGLSAAAALAGPAAEPARGFGVDPENAHPPPTCGTVPYPSNTGQKTPKSILNSAWVWSFVSEPYLRPMKVSVNLNKPGTSNGLVFTAPYTYSSVALYGQTGSLMLESNGDPIWFRPLSSPNLMNTDFRVQRLNGRPVLTFWQGTLATPPVYTDTPSGSSEPGSCYYILDDSYRVLQTVQAQNGFTTDVHEFLLTPDNTALLLSTRAVAMDLRPYGGPRNGYVQDFAIQEIDLRSNNLVFFWDALQHIPLADSYQPASSASSSSNIWDAYHLNSIGLTDDPSDILLSSRNTHTIYRIHKPGGQIVWQLGGKHSDFTIGTGADFSWQHDARFLSDNVVSMFDDNCCESLSFVPPGTPPSHGLFLQLDLRNKTASWQRAYYHDPNLNVASQGNTQSLGNGNIFIGWGQLSYYSEYSPGGKTLYSVQMPGSNISYRAYRDTWVGRPYYPPSIAVRASPGQTTVYAAWNGSTETVRWQVWAGRTPSRLTLVKVAARSGFETEIPVTSPGPYFQAKAVDARGQVIGASPVVQ